MFRHLVSLSLETDLDMPSDFLIAPKNLVSSCLETEMLIARRERRWYIILE